MIELCTQCGGEVKANGSGYKCIFCGTTFASLEELRPKPRATSTPQNTSSTVSATPKADNGVDVFETNINGVLEITWSDSQYKHSGSGFLISPNGYAITNTHVVTYEDGRSCKRVNVRICNESVTADVLKLGDNSHGEGKGVDLALIKLSRVPSKATVVKFENFEKVKNGERIFVIGNSLGYGTCITSGIVSDRLRNVNGKMLLMTDCAINGGNSGGPIFNEKGLVIGAVVSGITSAEGMNFAIPANQVLYFIEASNSGQDKYQMVKNKPNPYGEPSEPTFYAGEYRGPGTPPPRVNEGEQGGRFWGIGVSAPAPERPGGRFEGLPSTNVPRIPMPPPISVPTKGKALAPCPRCDSWNTEVENGIFVCLDCDFEG